MSLECLGEIELIFPVISKCPFCKSPASPNSHYGYCWVECHECGARGPKFSMRFSDSKPAYIEAIMAWAKAIRRS